MTTTPVLTQSTNPSPEAPMTLSDFVSAILPHLEQYYKDFSQVTLVQCLNLDRFDDWERDNYNDDEPYISLRLVSLVPPEVNISYRDYWSMEPNVFEPIYPNRYTHDNVCCTVGAVQVFEGYFKIVPRGNSFALQNLQGQELYIQNNVLRESLRKVS